MYVNVITTSASGIVPLTASPASFFVRSVASPAGVHVTALNVKPVLSIFDSLIPASYAVTTSFFVIVASSPAYSWRTVSLLLSRVYVYVTVTSSSGIVPVTVPAVRLVVPALAVIALSVKPVLSCFVELMLASNARSSFTVYVVSSAPSYTCFSV